MKFLKDKAKAVKQYFSELYSRWKAHRKYKKKMKEIKKRDPFVYK